MFRLCLFPTARFGYVPEAENITPIFGLVLSKNHFDVAAGAFFNDFVSVSPYSLYEQAHSICKYCLYTVKNASEPSLPIRNFLWATSSGMTSPHVGLTCLWVSKPLSLNL